MGSPLPLSDSLLAALRLLRATRSAMSTLASVVSLGSPGSVALEDWCSRARSEFARCRLLGGWVELPESVLRWCDGGPLDSLAVVSPSSADASRDSDACARAASSSTSATAVGRLRLPPCDDPDGEDMAAARGRDGEGSRAGSRRGVLVEAGGGSESRMCCPREALVVSMNPSLL